MGKLSLDERLNQIEKKNIGSELSAAIKDWEMRSDIIYLIMIREKNFM